MMNKYRSFSQPIPQLTSLNSRIRTNEDDALPNSKFSIKYQPKKKPSLPVLRLMKPFNDQLLSQLSTQPIPVKFIRLDKNNYDSMRKKITTKEKCRKIIDKIENSFEFRCTDEQPAQLCHKDAENLYYNNYRNLDKIEQENEWFNLKDSAQTSILRRTEQINLLPCKIGLIKNDGDPSEIGVTGYGDHYMDALGCGLENASNIKKIKLKRNRISSNGAMHVLQHARRTVELDFSINRIGQQACNQLSAIIKPRDCLLKELKLTGNLLGDKAIKELINQMIDNQSLKLVDLGENQLSDSETIGQLLTHNNYIKQLSLRWNLFRCGQPIFEALSHNESLKLLDLSFNNLGVCDDKVCIQKLTKFIQKNSTLQHFDLSNNQFNYQQCREIAHALKRNHSIYGFHFQGNYGYVDSCGFLILESKQIQNLNQKPIIQDSPIKIQRDFNELNKDICWICEKWQEWDFSQNLEKYPAFVHLGFDGFVQCFLGKKCTVKRMVPQARFKYYYSSLKNDGQKLLDQLDERIQFVDITKNVPIIGQNQLVNITILPRARQFRYKSNHKPKKNKWSFPISIWYKDYKFEDDTLLKQCFERDWNCCHIYKFVKNESQLQKIKDLLWKYYAKLKETYKYLASYYPQGDIWSISWNAITEFILNVGFVDGKNLKLSDVDLKFIATCSASIEWKGNNRHPERAIVRYQFLEFLVRLAEDKYIKYGIVQTPFEAVQLLIEQCEQHFNEYNSHKWRIEQYFTEECDMVCKKFKLLVDYLFSKYSLKKVKPGQKRFMSLDELHTICDKAGLIDENFVERDINLAYNLSMMTQIDELESDRIFQMSWIEFLEALARISEKWGKGNILHLKFEALMQKLLIELADQDTKQLIGISKKSLFDLDEIEDDKSSDTDY